MNKQSRKERTEMGNPRNPNISEIEPVDLHQSCVDCGANSGPGLPIAHHIWCVPGESDHWLKHYKESAAYFVPQIWDGDYGQKPITG